MVPKICQFGTDSCRMQLAVELLSLTPIILEAA